MATTRLGQFGVGLPAYGVPIDVNASTVQYGWETLPADIQVPLRPDTRLGQFGVGLANYPEITETPTVINGTVVQYGWQTFQAGIEAGKTVAATTVQYGWQTFKAFFCGFNRLSWSLPSFNAYTFPDCSFNDYVFGARVSKTVQAGVAEYGWEALPGAVVYDADVTISAGLVQYGWQSFPGQVSYANNIQCNDVRYGWQTFPAAVSVDVHVDCSVVDYGWQTFPISGGFANTIFPPTLQYGWETFPATIITPVFDIQANTAQYGWQTFPASLPAAGCITDADMDEIAQRTFQMMVDSGMVQQVLESWMRDGCDPGNPQRFEKYNETTGKITVGGVEIDLTGPNPNDITQTRKP